MYKSFEVISHNASRFARSESAPLLRQAVSTGPQVRPESRFAKSASRVMMPLLKASPLVRASMPSRASHAGNPAGLLNLRGLGGVRAYSDHVPPTELIARYKPVLEDAIAHHDEIVELVEHGNYSIASFVEIALDIVPGVSSIQLDNGYAIIGIQETPRVTNTTARMYDLKVMPPERPGGMRKPFVLPITVFKADAIKDANPSDLRMLIGMCSVAVDVHRGKLPRKLYSSINVFSPTIPELGKLYECVNKLKELISFGQVSNPTELFDMIDRQLKLRAVDPENKFVSALKSIVVEAFNNKYPGHELEIQRILIEGRTVKPAEPAAPTPPAQFRHSIEHKGGAYRAAMRMNTLAMSNPGAGFSAICEAPLAEPAQQQFTISFHPSGVWIRERNNPQTGEVEHTMFAKPSQLSEALKQRGVKAIISQSLGIL